jgi:hypothetical protein
MSHSSGTNNATRNAVVIYMVTSTTMTLNKWSSFITSLWEPVWTETKVSRDMGSLKLHPTEPMLDTIP